MDNYDEYFRVAKMLTEIHAKKKATKKEEPNNDDNKEEDEIDEKDNEDVEMVFDFSSQKKEKNADKNENKGEINEFTVNEKIETKESMNCSFIKDNINGDNSCSLFWNNNKANCNNQVFNFENNDNYLDNFNILRSKTIRFGERPKFSILNSQTESTSSQLFHNSINVFSRMSSISSINSNSINSNASNINNYEIQKVSTFKDKPKLGSLPLMCSNSIKTKNEHNSYGFFRSKTMKIDSTNNSKKNNKDEINKWLMRI